MKHAGVAAWFAGIAALVGLTIWSGADLVTAALASAGWGALLIVAVRVTTVSLAGAGWWLLFPPKVRPPLLTCLGLRFVREGANTLLPMAQVGGDLIGARLLTFGGVNGPLAAANVVVDILVQASTQFIFAMIGLATLIALGGDGDIARGAAFGIAIAILALGGFYLAQRSVGRRILGFVIERLAGDRKWRFLGTVDEVFDKLAMIYASRRSFFESTSVHLLGWLVGVLEVYLALRLMGHPISFAEALVIESLTHAVRGAAFAIPGALGAQEGALIVLCAIFGIPAEQALAVSLLKRFADLAVGIPGLIGWQTLEGARLRSRFSNDHGEAGAVLDPRASDR